MSLPDKCPFCGTSVHVMEDGKECRSGVWVTFDCHTSLQTVADPRRFQSSECEVRERLRLAARVAELEAEAKQARDDEAWAHQMHVGCIAREEDGWVASAWNVEMQSIDQANAATIHGALRAMREKVEGGAR